MARGRIKKKDGEEFFVSIIIDLETTGFDHNRDEITQIACYLMFEKVPDHLKQGFVSFVLPKEKFSDFISRKKDAYFHKITYNMLLNAPSLKELIKAFNEWIKSIHETLLEETKVNILLVAHNAEFEKKFLKKAYEIAEIPFPHYIKFVCSTLAANRILGTQSRSISKLMSFFDLKE
eukprot:TRINITY_DN721_c2_g1_i10.p2 TRINITY_DN721_c2_g1~~TRINITY_DN721_c2_g1_i10.p2  ORF type:complete len:177 (+),score=43.56 TRINITY_DN721_c2_g1_i10:1470-2000(+)